MPAEGGTTDFFLAKLDASSADPGDPVWGRRLEATGAVAGTVLTVSSITPAGLLASGGVVVTGTYSGAVDFGVGSLPDPSPATGAYLVRFDGSGATVWSFGIVPAIPGTIGAIDSAALTVLTPTDTVVVAGTAAVDADVAGISLPAGAFVARVKADDGTVQWAKSAGGCSARSLAAYQPKILMGANCPQPVDVGFGAVEGGAIFELLDYGPWNAGRGFSSNVTVYAVGGPPAPITSASLAVLFGTIDGPAELFPLGTKQPNPGETQSPFQLGFLW